MARSETATKLSTSGLCRASLVSPIGEITVVASPHGVRKIYFADPRPHERTVIQSIEPATTHDIVGEAVDQLQEYFAGRRRVFSVALDLVGTDFQCEAWRALAQIPYGETATYAQQATSIGRPRAVRAVGGANRMNPVPIVLPCHRVIGANGSLTGFAGGLETKQWLLEHERSMVSSEKEREHNASSR